MNHRSMLLESLFAYAEETAESRGSDVASEAFVQKAILLTFDLFEGPDITEDNSEEYAAVRKILYKYFGGNPLPFSEKLSDAICSDVYSPESRAYLDSASDRAENAAAVAGKRFCTADIVLDFLLGAPPPRLLSVIPKSPQFYYDCKLSPLMSMVLKASETVHKESGKHVTLLHLVAAVIKLFINENRLLRDCYNERNAAIEHIQNRFFKGTPQENNEFRYHELFDQIMITLTYSATIVPDSETLDLDLRSYPFMMRENDDKLITLDGLFGLIVDNPLFKSPVLDRIISKPPEHRQPDIEDYRENTFAYSPELISLLESINEDACENGSRRTCEEFVKRVLQTTYSRDINLPDDYIWGIGILLKHFGKLPALAQGELEKYINSPQYDEIDVDTLDNAHQRLLLAAERENKRALFVGDLLEEILSNPTKKLRDLFDSCAPWGRQNITYSRLANILWVLMPNLPNCRRDTPTCERFLAAALYHLGYSKPESEERKLSFEEKKVKEVLDEALGLERQSEENRHRHLHQLYNLLIYKIDSKPVGKRSENLFISLAEAYENEKDSPYGFAFDLLKFLFKRENSPLYEYSAAKLGDKKCNNLTKLDEMVSAAKNIRRSLSKKIYGQDNAINVFTTAYFRSLMASKDSVKPKATLLFAGPPGTGKTFMSETAAQALGLPFLRVDMSEYSDKEANLEFCGSDEVYKFSHEGYVTSFVSKNPMCVLLFDEIEKAHTNVIHLFLQMLDAGRLRDNYTDEEVSFRDAIIIMTTNAGRQLYENSESENLSGIPQSVVLDALAKDIDPLTGAPYFPAAICSRLASGSVVMFNHIEAAGLEQIAREELSRKKEELFEAHEIETDIDENVYNALLLSEGVDADARTIRARARAFFENELYELLSLVADNTAVGKTKSISIEADIPDSESISSLFSVGDKPSVLVFSSKRTAKRCRDVCKGIRVFSAQTVESAVDIIKREEIRAVLVDPSFGRGKNAHDYLNIEDVESLSRDFIRYIHDELKHLPVYLLLPDGVIVREEERLSFYRIGIKGCIELSEDFEDELATICRRLCRQESMKRLASANKVLTFETAQSASEDGSSACIKLFDFKLKTAVRAEDAKDILVSRPSDTFEDIIGAQEAKKELSYFVEYLKNPKKYIGFGTKTPKGVLLYGPPGTGKTMLARALACESGLTFIASEGNSFLKKYVGEGAKAVHKLFRTARKYAPAILFIDEIDAVAMARTGDVTDSTALTALLTELDGFRNDSARPVFVLAATNVDIVHGTGRGIDPALLRRFDRKVLVDLPAREDRRTFIAKKAAKNPAYAVTDSEIESIAMRSVGMSLAELDSMMELCLRCAIRAGSEKVTDEIFEDAFETFHSGEMKKWDESQLRRVAVHESGHAFICHSCGETPSYLTVVARDNYGGYMQHSDNETKAIYTKDELLGRIRTSLGGRAAEIVFYGENEGISTGASGDIESATKLAERMVSAYGMDRDFGLGYVRPEAGEAIEELRKTVNRILDKEMQKAVEMIERNKQTVERLADRLMERNYLIGEEIGKILNGGEAQDKEG